MYIHAYINVQKRKWPKDFKKIKRKPNASIADCVVSECVAKS